MLNIALGQIEVVSGRLNENFDSIKLAVDKAKAENMDLIVFPEMCIGGYLLADRFLDIAMCEELMTFNDKIKALSDGIGIIFGNIYAAPLNDIKFGRDGRPLRCNAAYFAYNNEWVKHDNFAEYPGLYIKHLNPDYRFFDDSRYFLSAIELHSYESFNYHAIHDTFTFKGHKIGLQICEDLWSNDYGVDLSAFYSQQNVEYIINISSSPYTINKELGRIKQIKKHMSDNVIPYFVYVNAVGMQNNGKNILVFDGDSSIYHKGEVIFNCNDAFDSEVGLFSGSKQLKQRADNKLLKALVYAIRKFDEQIFNAKTNWIIGLSGGLDSSISCALLVAALGNERIYAYNMATTYNSLLTKNNAAKLAQALQIPLKNGSIEQLVKATTATLIQEYGYDDKNVEGLVLENIQARVRGHLLSSFAGIHNGVICNNGNKVEVALGYCTLYGDSIGAISVLGDLLKTDLFELAKQINHEFDCEVIPTSLIPSIENGKIAWEMPPSAELKDDQVDPMKWYYHDELIRYLTAFPSYNIEALMQEYLDGSIYQRHPLGEWLKYYHLDDGEAFIKDLEWVLRQLRISVFKRIQMPPIITISRGAFGLDFRENQMNLQQTSKYIELREAILKKKYCSEIKG